MQFTFTVNVSVERVQGKFAARDDIADALIQAIEDAIGDADVSGHDADGAFEYEINDHDVTEEPQPKRQRRRKEQ